VVTYNSLIAACAQGAQAEKAQQIFDLMQNRGVRADSVTFGALISAYDRAGDWRNAFSSFEVIRSLGCRPDTVVYNTIIGCLWRTGIVKSQEVAMQIFHCACKQGHFRTSVSSDVLPRSPSNMSSPRMSANGSNEDSMPASTDAVLATTGDSHLPRVEYGMHAFTIGSAVLCLYRWLCEIRARATSHPDLPQEIIILTLNKGKPSRDHTYPVIKEALIAKLHAWKAPLDLVDTTVGCQIFGKSQDVAKWLDSDTVRKQLDVFLSFANPSMNGASEQLYRGDAITESRCREAFSAVKQLESLNAAMHGGPSSQGPVHDQEELFLEMASYAKSSGSCPEDVLYDGFDILLWVIEFGDDDIMSFSNHWLVRACYFYAAVLAMGEVKAADAVGLMFQPDRQEILSLTERIKRSFNGKLSSISPSRVLKLYLERIGVFLEANAPFNHPTAGVSFSLLPFSVSSVSTRKYSASILAAAVLVVGRRNAGISPFWPQVLEQMTGYSTEEGTILSSAVASISCLPAGGAFEL
jgi:pentatricopeptide repeat domain-containing protein 1